MLLPRHRPCRNNHPQLATQVLHYRRGENEITQLNDFATSYSTPQWLVNVMQMLAK
jgi:hypothetical protein